MDHWSPEHFQRADAVFDAALDFPSGERAAFVARACADDAQLCADVERLLRAHDRSDAFLSTPARELAAPLVSNVDLAASRHTSDVGPPPDRIGPYRIEREIGRGGMGVVYLAERDDPNFRQRVALKLLRGNTTDGRADIGRFLTERRLLASLEHPHIARLFDGGVTTDGLPYYTMAYCEGGSLAQRLRVTGALPIEEALRIVRQLAAALAAAHARGVVHRDVKPANVLFDADGSVRLTDFGIAKLLDDEATRTGAVLGTIAYLAPEQVASGAIDRRTDLWSLGVTLYEMLCGRRPFEGSSYAAVMHAIMSVEPEPLNERVPAIPATVDALVGRLLQKDPALRPESADAVIRALDGAGSTSAPAGSVSTRRIPRRRAALVAIGILALIGAGAGYFASSLRQSAVAAVQPAPEKVAAPSVAVLPFVNTSGEADVEPLVDGLTEELIGTLGKVRGLRVIARTSVFALKGKNLPARKIADTLGVDHVLEGSIRRVGNQLRVLAQLVNARSDSVIWSEQYDREVKDVFSIFGVQREIARAVGGAMRVQLALGADVPHPTADSKAYELYLKGRSALYNRSGPAGLTRAVRYFEAAIARDSNYAGAYSGLSDAYASLGNFGYGRPGEVFAKARAAALRALQLDSTLAEARTSLAHTMCVYDFEWAAADREFRRAIAADPSYPFARMAFAVCLGGTGHAGEAIAQLDTAHQLDPLRFGVSALRGRIYVMAGRPDEAIAALEEAIDLNPLADLAWQQLGEAYLLKRMPAEAISAFRRAALLSGVRDSAQLAYAYAVTGGRASAERIVRDLVASSRSRYVPPFHMAMAYSGLGQVDEAFRWLDRAYAERASFIGGVKYTRAFAPLHGDPRWGRLLAKMGLDG